MADQWKEFFYCDAIPAEVLAVKGQKRVSGRSSNKHGSDNIISNGSVIAVADGQCMMIVEQGKVVDVCAEPGEVWLLDVQTALRAMPPEGSRRLTENLLRLCAQKNLALSERIFCTASKTIRGRLLTYLSAQSVRAGAKTFRIPFDRQQLADFLSVNRSAMSAELSRMQEEGLLRVSRSAFTLLQKD